MLKRITIAFFKAQARKGWKLNTLAFSLNWESNCFKLSQEILKRNYKIKSSLCFISLLPIKREIFAGDFSDRIVHHYLFSQLYNYYEQRLINDCYSCRLSKGTSFGIKRASLFLRAVSDNYTKTAYVLKLDISGYFMDINRNLLYRINQKLIKELFKDNEPEKNLTLYLLRKIIFNQPTLNCKLRAKREDWQGLPKNKSLFYAKDHCGLPIGNLTSQLFGNIYLNNFDHFVKEKLKVKYYGRYVDDMFFMHRDKEFLKKIIPQISDYLEKKLELKIHPQKIYLQEIKRGLPFLGVIIKPGHIYPNKRIIKNFRRKINLVVAGKLDNPSFFNSYLGQLKHYNSYRLRKKIMEGKRTKIALKILKQKVNHNYTKIGPVETPFFPGEG